jgi:phosphoglycerate dehydrogenase-like enzyme
LPAEVITVLCPAAHDRPAGIAVVEERAEVRHVVADELGEALVGADALFVWDFFSQALPAAWPSADRLRWVHVAAAGVDRFLFPALTRSDVVLTNARGVFDRPIAEYVLSVVLAQVNGLPATLEQQRARQWRPRFHGSVESQAVLVVGSGSIGREVARLLRCVGLRVTGVARRPREDDDFDRVVGIDDVRRFLPGADHVVLALPLTADTRDLVDAGFLAAMKPGAHLVNVGRGELVDEEALLAALRDGRLGGASLDVFREEPLQPEHPLWTTPGVLVSPHMSGLVDGVRDRMARQFVENALRFLDGRPLLNVVDKQLGFVDGAACAVAVR